MRNLLLLSALAGVAITANAQQHFSFTELAKPKTELNSRQTIQGKMAGTDIKNTDNSGRLSVRVVPQSEMKKAGGVDYGPEVGILAEDFSKMSTGSIGAPDLDTYINNPEISEYPAWQNVDPSFTSSSIWGATNVYPAGGVACLYATPETGGAAINSPLCDVSGYCGIFKLRFKARTDDDQFNEGLYVQATETYNMSPTWDFIGQAACPETYYEWQTYEVTFYGGGGSTMFLIATTEGVPVYIDDVELVQIDQYVYTPEILPHTNYQGTTFDLNWKAVDGAESYLVDIYNYDYTTGQMSEFKLNEKAETNKYTVTGAESGAGYMYAVRSVKGNHESMPSSFNEIWDLEAPVLETNVSVKNGKYTAKWNEVPTAERYNYWALYERFANADGEFAVTDENFDNIKTTINGELGEPTGTKEDPNFNVYGGDHFIVGLNQAGWKGKNYMDYKGYACVDGWHYIMGDGDAGILSPELDLSKDNGKITVSAKLAGELAEYVTEWGADGRPVTVEYYQTIGAAALFNWNEDKQDFEQAELVYFKDVKEDWGTYTINLTKGSKRSKLGIFAVQAPGNLYIDDLKITQNYKAGESLVEPFEYDNYYDWTQLEVTLPEKAMDANVFHKVCAVKGKTMGQYQTDIIESKYSNLEQVQVSTGIDGCKLVETPTVVMNNGQLTVNNAGKAVEVYTVDGKLVAADKSGRSNTQFNLSARGMYVVKVAGQSVKVVY